jgi:hypothetical protein
MYLKIIWKNENILEPFHFNRTFSVSLYSLTKFINSA